MNKTFILGISSYYHDSAAALILDGEILEAVQEERFTRKKHDPSFPINAVKYCLNNQNISLKDISHIVYYEKPLLTFERLLETYLSTAPRGIRSFIPAMQTWVKEKLFIKSEIKKQLNIIEKEISSDFNNSFKLPELFFSEHHLSHAASAFYPSPFEKSIILCMDGVGEWATTSAWIGHKNKIEKYWEISFPHSLGLLYSAFTYFCGFKVNSGEYKLMGLAPYGNPLYVELIKKEIVDIKEDGTYKLNMKYFKYHRGLRMTSSAFDNLFKAKPRKKESELTQFHMDLAASIQKVTEEIVLKLSKSLREETGIKNICLAGGVALNCVANGKLQNKNIFENIWIQPASGDAGTSLGAALAIWHMHLKNKRKINQNDSMKGAYLGPSFSNNEIKKYLDKTGANYKFTDTQKIFEMIANYLVGGKVIGLFNGRMEFGPRALGSRSIIGDPRNTKMQSIMNLKIKYRESFRPFAPSILLEDINEYFELNTKSPYMLLVSNLKKEICNKMSIEEEKLFGIEKLNVVRSKIPAVTHIDYSARIQTVEESTNYFYYNVIKKFKEKTGCPIIINTSFNVRGEPIVCTPQDAYRCFMRTEMDILILENYILTKEMQPKRANNKEWQKEFELD